MAPETPTDHTVEKVAKDLAADIKPKLRGWLHASAIPLSLVGGILLIVFATSTLGRVGGAVYLAASLLLFGTSATYHRFGWGKTGAAILRRMDHSNIYVFIAATYTPLALLLLTGTSRVLLLTLIWAEAILGPDQGQQEDARRTGEQEERERCVRGGDEHVDVRVVHPPQDRSARLAPAEAVVRGAGAEQQQRRSQVHRAAYPAQRRSGEHDEEDAAHQRQGGGAGVEPAAQLRFDVGGDLVGDVLDRVIRGCRRCHEPPPQPQCDRKLRYRRFSILGRSSATP